ncbi:HesB/YadR/YfhF family protein [Peribacillus alkalitolerans]|uniref:HesB/YadR/YfhF family protein n=1 Tax=Peribacillus alkalitolerans TaxID=1550385 RepID=UPI0013D27E47|nr:HesB/YadR/YfhF family protein [Peribacillus alkalitolerans]
MNLTITDEAAKWYIDELGLKGNENSIRFYVRYGGYSPIQAGFSLGISDDAPISPIATTEIMGIQFFIEEKDAWYFEGHDLVVGFNTKMKEPEFSYR